QTARQESVSNLVALYEKRRDAFVAAVTRFGWTPYVPKGAFYVLMPVPEGYTSSSFADLLLEEANVAVADASGFGDGGEGYV
ncbi:aminotransferase class I/II-fold pyridoxal phosphate-dependent enzyme, partial [Leuconostoc suionicum]